MSQQSFSLYAAVKDGWLDAPLEICRLIVSYAKFCPKVICSWNVPDESETARVIDASNVLVMLHERHEIYSVDGREHYKTSGHGTVLRLMKNAVLVHLDRSLIISGHDRAPVTFPDPLFSFTDLLDGAEETWLDQIKQTGVVANNVAYRTHAEFNDRAFLGEYHSMDTIDNLAAFITVVLTDDGPQKTAVLAEL